METSCLMLSSKCVVLWAPNVAWKPSTPAAVLSLPLPLRLALAGDEKQQVENVAADLGKEDARTAGDVAEDLEDNGAMEGASGDDDAGQDHESSQLGNANEDLNMRWMGGALPGSNDSGLKDSAPTAGCTAVVALVAGKRLLVANAGDSRCVCSRRGEAIAMSEDHKPEHPEELARITKVRVTHVSSV